jgi:5'-3' exonuclease
VSPILLVDLSALFWRYWHSTNSGPQAYEFTIDHLIELVAFYPRMVICCEGTRPIRFEWFADYKANRPPKPEGAKESLRQIITEMQDTPGIPVARVDYCEADDVIATLAIQASKIGQPVHILSRDKDLYSLIDDNVRLVIDGTGDDKLIDREECFAKFGVHPHQIRDYLAIVGDASDNVPGCPGIGAKGAAALLQRFGNLETARAATDEALGLKPKALANFRAWDPTLAVKLVTLITDAPININNLFPETETETETDMADMTKITTDRKNGPLKIVAYGPEGVGKTRFGAFSNKPIFLCAESGLTAPDLKDTPSFPSPDGWPDVLAAIEFLRTTEHGYRTLVVDSLDWLYQHVKADVQAREKMTAAQYEDYGRGDKFALDYWVKLTQAFDALQAAKGMHIIVIAHSGMETFQNPQGEDFVRYQLALSKKAAERWKQWPDFLLFMSQELFTKKNKDDKGTKGIMGEHRIFTERNAAFDAKNRINLPPEIAYETANPWRAFTAAVKEVAAPKAPVKTETKSESEAAA